jgi:membrane associated rhomboid family serine protease
MDSTTIALHFGFNYQSIVGANQYYRFITAAFTHQGVAHILFNMCALAVFSVSLEKAYGTYFFTALNLWILLICSSLQLLYDHVRIFWLPIALGGAKLDLIMTYSVGYSAILFGLIMLISLSGDKHIDIYGCKVRKILLPFGYLIFSQMLA